MALTDLEIEVNPFILLEFENFHKMLMSLA